MVECDALAGLTPQRVLTGALGYGTIAQKQQMRGERKNSKLRVPQQEEAYSYALHPFTLVMWF